MHGAFWKPLAVFFKKPQRELFLNRAFSGKKAPQGTFLNRTHLVETSRGAYKKQNSRPQGTPQ
jgi:hypothetical protein